jgi:hypothetical protein
LQFLYVGIPGACLERHRTIDRGCLSAAADNDPMTAPSTTDNRHRTTTAQVATHKPAGHAGVEQMKLEKSGGDGKAGGVSSACENCLQNPCICAALLKLARQQGIPPQEALPGLKKKLDASHARELHATGAGSPTARVGANVPASSMPPLDPAVIAAQARVKV